MEYGKLEKVLELLEEISELYPNMEKVVLNDSDNPDYIIITSNEFIEEMSNAFGISEEFAQADIEDFYADIPKTDKKKRKLQ